MNPDLSCLRGWILDLYPSPEGMVLWLVDETGQAHRLAEPFPMALYVGGASRALAALEHTLAARYPRLRLARARRFDIFLDREIEVLEATAPNPIAYRALFRELDVLAEVAPRIDDHGLAVAHEHVAERALADAVELHDVLQ